MDTSILNYPDKGPFLYYVRVKGWVGGIAKYLLFLTGVEGGFGSSLRKKKREGLLDFDVVFES